MAVTEEIINTWLEDKVTKKELRKQVEEYHKQMKELVADFLSGITLTVHEAHGDIDGIRLYMLDGAPVTLDQLHKQFETTIVLDINDAEGSLCMHVNGTRNKYREEWEAWQEQEEQRHDPRLRIVNL